ARCRIAPEALVGLLPKPSRSIDMSLPSTVSPPRRELTVWIVVVPCAARTRARRIRHPSKYERMERSPKRPPKSLNRLERKNSARRRQAAGRPKEAAGGFRHASNAPRTARDACRG